MKLLNLKLKWKTLKLKWKINLVSIMRINVVFIIFLENDS